MVMGLRSGFTRLPMIWRIRGAALVGVIVVNSVAVMAAVWLARSVVRVPAPASTRLVEHNLLLLLAFALVVLVYGHLITNRSARPVLAWLLTGRQPSDRQKRSVLSLPRRIFLHHALWWSIGLVIFAVYNAEVAGWDLGWVVFQFGVLSGLGACSVSYLIAERLLRPIARYALRTGVPERVRVRSVAMRTLFAWAFGTITPVVGAMLVSFRVLTADDRDDPLPRGILALIVLALGAITLCVGGLSIWLAAGASSDPVRSLRRSLSEVAHGDLNAHVDIYDGTEIGLLQAGFNEMVLGLRERERMRELFGRHVGGDVAQAALEGGGSWLRGESRRVGVLFVDIIGSTGMANEQDPAEVIALLNRFFDVVIEVVHAHEGWINKFEGDAALAIWGAPLGVADMEAKALAAARSLSMRLEEEFDDLKAGIGVSAGTAVAGNLGASERYEYTVIGDPVNEASRLSELAKKYRSRVVANAAMLESGGSESTAWTERKPVKVRGRRTATRIAVPVD